MANPNNPNLTEAERMKIARDQQGFIAGPSSEEVYPNLDKDRQLRRRTVASSNLDLDRLHLLVVIEDHIRDHGPRLKPIKDEVMWELEQLADSLIEVQAERTRVQAKIEADRKGAEGAKREALKRAEELRDRPNAKPLDRRPLTPDDPQYPSPTLPRTAEEQRRFDEAQTKQNEAIAHARNERRTP